MRSVFSILPVSAIALALASPAFAQDAVASEDDSAEPIIHWHRTIPQTIIVIGAPQALDALANSVTRITQSDLDTVQLPVVSDLLARVPGVTATRNGPFGGFTGVRIRGADAAQTLVIINGIRVSDPTSPGGGFDFGNLLADNIASIDVQRGSNSVTWGSDAIGGVVLISTGGSNRFTAEYGSNDSYRANGQWTVSGDAFRVSAGGGYFSTDGISSARSGTEADGFRQYAANVSGVLDLTDTLNVSVNAIFADGRLDLDGFAPPTFSFGDTAEFQRTQEIYTSAAIQHRLGDFSHRVSFAVADINRDNFDPAAGDAPTFFARGRTERLAWQGRYDAGSVDLVGGVDREWSRSLTGSSFSSDGGRTAITGAYGNAALAAGERLTLGIGARHDDHRQFGGNIVLSGNARFELSDALALRATFAEGFKAPTLFQLSGTSGGFGNPALEPERSRGGDVGVVWAQDGNAIRFSLFRRDSRNLIDFVGCSGPTAPAICGSGTRPFGTYANVARARAQGVEIEMTVQPSAGLTVTGGYSYIDARDRSIGTFNSGNRLARRPAHTALVGVDYRHDAFTLGGDVQLIGDSFDDAGNFTRLDGYALVTVRGSVTVTDQFELFGRVENLFDAAYQNVAGYGAYGRTASIGVRARL